MIDFFCCLRLLRCVYCVVFGLKMLLHTPFSCSLFFLFCSVFGFPVALCGYDWSYETIDMYNEYLLQRHQGRRVSAYT
jgi:hypothetical protein